MEKDYPVFCHVCHQVKLRDVLPILKHYPGYLEARTKVLQMDDDALLQLIDLFYGRAGLPQHPTHDEILAEALKQHERDWTEPPRRDL